MLTSDFDNLVGNQRTQILDKLIYEEAQISDKNVRDHNITLNQAQILNVIKRLYDPQTSSPQRASVVTPVKAPLQYQQRQMGLTEVKPKANGDEYVEWYQRAKILQQDKKWSDDKFQKMLSDRKALDKEWKSVSAFFRSIIFVVHTIKEKVRYRTRPTRVQ